MEIDKNQKMKSKSLLRKSKYSASTGEEATIRGGSCEKENTSEGSITRLRKTVFPIYGKIEVKKFLLIGSIKFFIILALTLTRDTKDTLVVTECGAEAIAFLKVSQFTNR